MINLSDELSGSVRVILLIPFARAIISTRIFLWGTISSLLPICPKIFFFELKNRFLAVYLIGNVRWLTYHKRIWYSTVKVSCTLDVSTTKFGAIRLFSPANKSIVNLFLTSPSDFSTRNVSIQPFPSLEFPLEGWSFSTSSEKDKYSQRFW